MKSTIKTILIFLTISICYAQSEPESINGKDLIEKIDRSDLELNDLDDGDVLENEIPKMEMPTLTFKKKPVSKVEKPTKKSIVKPENTVKKEVVNKKETKSKPAASRKPTTRKPTTKMPTTKKSTTKKSTTRKPTTKKAKKKKIIVSDRRMSLKNLKNNDKVVVAKSVTYIYRLEKSKTVQYKFIGKLPLNSSALESKGINSYYIRDVKKLIADSKATFSTSTKNKTTITVKAKNKPKTIVKKAVDKVEVNKQAETRSTSNNGQKKLETKHNHGRTISQSIELNQLMKNDVIHLSGNAKLVIRRDRNTYKIHKYWLKGELDLRSRSLRKQSDIKYKVLKEYAPR